MPGLVPGIHVLFHGREKGVDGREEPGHDGKGKRQTVRETLAMALTA